jgi:D-alanyl-D-alanine carboxypeptidase
VSRRVSPEEIRTETAARLSAAGVPGAAIALVADGAPPLALGVGHRDLGRTVPLPADARFPIYSITKTFVAVAALQLAEAGRLDLDAPLAAIVPVPALPPAVTIRRLLNHTAGLSDYGALAAYHADLLADPGTPWTPEQFVARTLRQGASFPPGEGWSYSNLGFLFVRQAIERLTGRTLREVLADQIFQPLGMTQTSVAGSLTDMADLTPGFSADLDRDGAPRDISRRYHPGWVAPGLVLSTAPEVALALDRMIAGDLVGTPARAAMLDPVPVGEDHPLFGRAAYGLGVMVDLASPHGRVAGHAGGGPGYSTAAFHFPNLRGHRVTAVVLVNRDRPDDLAMRIAFDLASFVGQSPGPLQPDQTRRNNPG